jgi:hypothetical protein
MANRHELTQADILPPAEYAAVRDQQRRRVGALKRDRRLEVGPYVTFLFESYDTMWLQVHEMIFIEKGGAEQVAGELAAYNPLVPKGAELVATFMIEIDDPARRKRMLAQLGGIEETAFLRLGGETITAVAEADQDRTTAEGKASAVQFVHFPFSAGQIARFKAPGTEVVLGLNHPNYAHMTVLPEATRRELAKDFA